MTSSHSNMDTHNIYFLFKIVDMALVHLVRYRIGGMY